MSPCTTFFAKLVRYDLRTVEVIVYDVYDLLVLDDRPFRIFCVVVHMFFVFTPYGHRRSPTTATSSRKRIAAGLGANPICYFIS